MKTAIFIKTPTIVVMDNRDLSIRTVAYHRHPDTPDTTEARITHNGFHVRGYLASAADPRLYAAGRVNLTNQADLSGQIIRTASADAGLSVQLNDAVGRSRWVIENMADTDDREQAITRRWQYEAPELPGRILSVSEQQAAMATRITDRFIYSGNSAQEKSVNLAGQCARHYDTSGLVQTESIALAGSQLSVIRRLLRDADNPDTLVDWHGDSSSSWDALLDNEQIITTTRTQANGAISTSTDAAGHQQHMKYDVAGNLSGCLLTLKNGNTRTIVKRQTYSAAGQTLREEHGNGVVTTYAYEAETQRTMGIKTCRPAGHVAGEKVLQDLSYCYDPTGNVLSVRNAAQETLFWRNQEIVPENTYIYDSLYQLVSASGRELASISGNAAGFSLPEDDCTYTNYTRTYRYDAGNNLTQMQHYAPATNNNFTTSITVSDRSNRGVLATLASEAADVDTLFTPGGQQKQLQPGQSLGWTTRGELHRAGSGENNESYRYDSESQRVLKVSARKTGGDTQTQRVVYVPGLEMRITTSGSTQIENQQVICVGETGGVQVRVIHWESGKPEEISNDRVCYRYDSPTGSSQLELDEEGKIISLEEYYPFGSTSACIARSQTEARYKTVRYSGKERDATGLYYFGYRYYQPWAGRWLSADPAGTVDGLNVFCMVHNNPVTLKDRDGRKTDWLDLATGVRPQALINALYKSNPILKKYHEMFTRRTQGMLAEAASNDETLSKLPPQQVGRVKHRMWICGDRLKGYLAHAGVLMINERGTPISKAGFVNMLPKVNRWDPDFPGIVAIAPRPRRDRRQYATRTLERSKKWIPVLDFGFHKIVDIESYIGELKRRYQESGTALHPLMEKRIRAHIVNNNYLLPTIAGLPGLHAEVQALNFVLSKQVTRGRGERTLNNSFLFTQHLHGANRGRDFPSCYNCSGIMSGFEHFMAGRTNSYRRITRRNSV
ncbi:TPA: RHS repeat protein [Enterobacter soli]|nr:RHS repeat protein [Enterobacter soli]